MGGTANLIIHPEERLVVALLVNSDYTFIGAARCIALAYLGPPQWQSAGPGARWEDTCLPGCARNGRSSS